MKQPHGNEEKEVGSVEEKKAGRERGGKELPLLSPF